MPPMSEITVLGLDNVLLDVGDLEVAKGFYGGRLGLGVKFDFPDAGVVGFRLGDEEAGLFFTPVYALIFNGLLTAVYVIVG